MLKTPRILDVEQMTLFTEFCNNQSLAPSNIILYGIYWINIFVHR